MHFVPLFTQADQVGNWVVTARESDPDLGFQARMMALCSLAHEPRSTGFSGKNGPYKLQRFRQLKTDFPRQLSQVPVEWIFDCEAVKIIARVGKVGRGN